MSIMSRWFCHEKPKGLGACGAHVYHGQIDTETKILGALFDRRQGLAPRKAREKKSIYIYLDMIDMIYKRRAVVSPAIFGSCPSCPEWGHLSGHDRKLV